MIERIYIANESIGKVEIELLHDKNPKTCKAIIEALPLELDLSSWGDELYGTIPVDTPSENPQEECEIGDVAYWLQGSGFCILFGKTPASKNEKPRLISPGNVFGRIENARTIFKGMDSFKGKLVGNK